MRKKDMSAPREKQGLAGTSLAHKKYEKQRPRENILYLAIKISIVPVFPNNDGIDHVDP